MYFSSRQSRQRIHPGLHGKQVSDTEFRALCWVQTLLQIFCDFFSLVLSSTLLYLFDCEYPGGPGQHEFLLGVPFRETRTDQCSIFSLNITCGICTLLCALRL